VTRIPLATPEQTHALGRALATLARPGAVFGLAGPLGAGKTCLARGLISTLAPDTEEIVSPTFTLVQTYDTVAGVVWHFDLYRLKRAEEVIELGFEDALADICLIEWPERLGRMLPRDVIDVTLAHAGDQRIATVEGLGKWVDEVTVWATALRIQK
jgi:tRNA threonylcarbamoyladenosine biosynthesis protein TsaE